MTSKFSFGIPAMNAGKNPRDIYLQAEQSGDPGIYNEILVHAHINDNCIADVLIGLDSNGEMRVAITSDGMGDRDYTIAVFPERPMLSAVEHLKV